MENGEWGMGIPLEMDGTPDKKCLRLGTRCNSRPSFLFTSGLLAPKKQVLLVFPPYLLLPTLFFFIGHQVFTTRPVSC
jgi:hypothetical protein